MQLPQLRFWISKEKKPLVGNVLTGEVSFGDPLTYLTADGKLADLKNSPDGWQSVLVKFGRNNSYKGLFRDFTVPLKFTGDGALILRHLFWKYGIEAPAELIIHQLDRFSFPGVHRLWYKGDIDFSKFKEDENFVTVNVMEGGAGKYLKAFDSQDYEINILEEDHGHIYFDGIYMHEKHYFITQDALLNNISLIGSLFLNKEGNASGAASFSVYANTIAFGYNFSTSDQYFFTTLKDIAGVEIEGTYKYQDLTGIGPLSLLLRSDQGRNETIATSATPNGEITFSHFFDANATEKFFFVADQTGFQQHVCLESKFSIKFRSRFRATYVACMSPFDLGTALVKRMTAGKYGFKSDYLLNLKTMQITSGLALRGSEKPFIKTNLKDLVQSVSGLNQPLGLGVEGNNIVVEPLNYFYRDGVSINLGKVVDCEISAAEDQQFNSIKVGYPNQNYEDTNGLVEFNVTQKWTTPITRVIRELDLTSVYRTDPIGMELQRLNYTGVETKDSKDDNDTFMINTREGISSFETTVSFVAATNSLIFPLSVPLFPGQTIEIIGSALNATLFSIDSVANIIVAQLATLLQPVVDEGPVNVTINILDGKLFYINRPAYSAISGILETETIFNTEYSPHHRLLNFGAEVRNMLHRQDDGKLVYTKSDKNSELSTTLGGVTVTENEDIPISSLKNRYLLPYYAEFKTEVPVNLLQIFSGTDRYKKVAFTYKGVELYGYIEDAGFNPATNEAQTWKLILSSDNDLSKLVFNG